MAPYSVLKEKNTANISTDRVLKLKNKRAKSSSLMDPKVFSGEVELHAVQDAGLWHLKYIVKSTKLGGSQLPEALRQRWTSFGKLMQTATQYFEGRHIEIEEVIA